MVKRRENSVSTRASLIARLKDWGDKESWEDFFNTYERLIYGVAIQSDLTAAEAEDVLQESMIAVAKNIREFNYNPARGSFRSWLINRVRWKILD